VSPPMRDTAANDISILVCSANAILTPSCDRVGLTAQAACAGAGPPRLRRTPIQRRMTSRRGRGSSRVSTSHGRNQIKKRNNLSRHATNRRTSDPARSSQIASGERVHTPARRPLPDQGIISPDQRGHASHSRGGAAGAHRATDRGGLTVRWAAAHQLLEQRTSTANQMVARCVRARRRRPSLDTGARPSLVLTKGSHGEDARLHGGGLPPGR